MKLLNFTSPRATMFAAVLGVACLGAGAWVVADDPNQPPQVPQQEPQDQPRHQQPNALPGQSEPIKLEGTVAYYNLGPMGDMESMNLTTGDGLVQLIIPPGAGDKVAAIATEGTKAEATAMAEPQRPPRGLLGQRPGGQDEGPDGGAADRGPQVGGGQNGQGGQNGPPARGANASKPDHKVYRLVSITVGDKTLDLAAKFGQAQAAGVIKHLNYDRGGRIDGAILDSGEFVLVPPAAAATMKLQVGQKMIADGMSRQLANGLTVLMARTVNGVAVQPQQQNGGPDDRGPRDGDQRGGPQDGGQGGERGGRPGGGPDGDHGPGPGGQ